MLSERTNHLKQKVVLNIYNNYFNKIHITKSAKEELE